MLQIGEQIVHPRYGAGVVKETREITYEGETREYFCIELVGDRGIVMVQQDFLDDLDLRKEIITAELVQNILFNTPNELSTNHRTRQAKLKSAIDSGKPRKILQALRDLCWFEKLRDRLSASDLQLRKRAHRLITQELALRSTTDETLQKAALKLDRIIMQAMNTHSNAQPSEAS